MMNTPSASLAPRREGLRDKRVTLPQVVAFSLREIKAHFDENIAEINCHFAWAAQYRDHAQIIWRSQIVFLESALDFYLHELSKYGVVQIFNGNGQWKATDGYNSMKFTMEDLTNAIRNPETIQWLLEAISEKFSHEVFLETSKIRHQCLLLGVDFNAVCEQAGIDPFQLGRLCQRRNQIAHQADRNHLNAEMECITEEFVRAAITLVTNFVHTLHEACLRKE